VRGLPRNGTAAALALASLLPPSAAFAADETVAIEHARVYPGDGRRLDDATVLVRGDTIAAVGPSGEVKVPASVRRIDGRGQVVTAGLIDAESSTGLADVFMEKTSVETGLDERYDAIRAAFSVLDGLNPRAVGIPVTRLEGVTSVVLAPTGGLVEGQGAAIRLDGLNVPAMLVRSPVAVYASMAEPGRQLAYGARGGLLLRLRELFDDVRQYARRKGDFERNQMRKVAASRLDLEALIPVVERRLPLVVEVHRAADIEAALRLARTEKVDLVLTGAEEGWQVAGEIAAAKVPVIVSALPDLPRSFEALAARLENAALLAAAGVKIAISPRARSEHNSRTLRLEAGNAVANGLPWEAALAAVTRAPAEIFDLGGKTGTVAVGASADLVLWTGDPFEPLTRPRRILIGGREIPMQSRQTELRDRYRPAATRH
jgi:imidazolonepropionase-like amidohydrolase